MLCICDVATACKYQVGQSGTMEGRTVLCCGAIAQLWCCGVAARPHKFGRSCCGVVLLWRCVVASLCPHDGTKTGFADTPWEEANLTIVEKSGLPTNRVKRASQRPLCARARLAAPRAPWPAVRKIGRPRTMESRTVLWFHTGSANMNTFVSICVFPCLLVAVFERRHHVSFR